MELKDDNDSRESSDVLEDAACLVWQTRGAECRATQDELRLAELFQEIIIAVAEQRANGVQAGRVIATLLQEEIKAEDATDSVDGGITSIFLDSLSIWAETGADLGAMVDFLQTTEIPPARMRMELESGLLEQLGLIRGTFVRVGIRRQTNLLYRQSNYNLLREETEGYSKLITELFTVSNNDLPTNDVVHDMFERVKGMIGAFDLDVGRVLDITLDVFAAVLVKQYRFFVKYLRVSSWWPHQTTSCVFGPLPLWALPDHEQPQMADRRKRDEQFWHRCRQIGMDAFFELGQRETADAQQTDDAWTRVTKTRPPEGNKVAAQILGFKLRFYASSARDLNDTLPLNLISLAALLIKIGFISLRDLYAHIWPADDGMSKLRELKMREKSEADKAKTGGPVNALLAAAPLPDDTLDPREAMRLRESERDRRKIAAKTLDNAAEDTLPEPAEQKVQLLKSLLCIGALPEALFMLGRHPWITDVFEDLPEYIHRILHHCLSQVYEPLRPLRMHPTMREQQSSRVGDSGPRKVMRWAQLDRDDTNEAIDYKFFWDDWADLIPVCQHVDDVFTLFSTIANLTGVRIGQDVALLVRLARIGVSSLCEDSTERNMTRWIDLSKRLLVPALSFTKGNPGAVNEVFELIKHFPAPVRYNIYGEWTYGQISRLPEMKAVFDVTRSETRDVLKRISKTNIKPMARALAKIAYASPAIVFSVAIGQLESYDNIVDTFVECARYLTYLAYDVLTWSLMSALGASGRDRLQSNGLLTSKWLAALATFAGKVFKRYSIMNPLSVVQYVVDQLRMGNATHLLVLENIIGSMAGIISDSSNFNENQIIALGGGELLQAQILRQLLDRRHESKITARRLIRPLTDSGIAGQVLISLAQERQMCIFHVEEADAHPKLLGNVFDQIHRVLGQYLDLLRSNLTVAEFDQFVPNVSSLVVEYGIDPAVAFWISRPSINAAVLAYDGDKVLKPNDAQSQEESEDAIDEVQLVRVMEVDADPASAKEDDPTSKIFHPLLQEITQLIQPRLPSSLWMLISPIFYTTFWQLSLGDVFTSLEPYHDAQKRLEKNIKTISEDRSDVSTAGQQRKTREKKALIETVGRLHKEMKDCMQANIACKARLRKEKGSWFHLLRRNSDRLNVALIQHCFLPRLLLSPLDAMYAFKMIKLLHSENVANFRTIGLYDQLFMEQRLSGIIFLCSAKESECLGRFLKDVLRDLSAWHADQAIYEKEAFGAKRNLSGFILDETFLDYEEFRRLLLKWHRHLNNALKTCYSSGEYMHIRNAINVLNNVHHHFPAVNWMGKNQLAAMQDLSKQEGREDLKIAAASLYGALKRREGDWVLPQAFNIFEAPPPVADNISKALDPLAPPFEPTTPSNGEQPPNAREGNQPEGDSQSRAPSPEETREGQQEQDSLRPDFSRTSDPQPSESTVLESEGGTLHDIPRSERTQDPAQLPFDHRELQEPLPSHRVLIQDRARTSSGPRETWRSDVPRTAYDASRAAPDARVEPRTRIAVRQSENYGRLNSAEEARSFRSAVSTAPTNEQQRNAKAAEPMRRPSRSSDSLAKAPPVEGIHPDRLRAMQGPSRRPPSEPGPSPSSIPLPAHEAQSLSARADRGQFAAIRGRNGRLDALPIEPRRDDLLARARTHAERPRDVGHRVLDPSHTRNGRPMLDADRSIEERRRYAAPEGQRPYRGDGMDEPKGTYRGPSSLGERSSRGHGEQYGRHIPEQWGPGERSGLRKRGRLDEPSYAPGPAMDGGKRPRR